MDGTITRGSFLETALPPMTYGDLTRALEKIASGEQHRLMIPYLVSALWQQSPYLSGELAMFEIVASANCLADSSRSPILDG